MRESVETLEWELLKKVVRSAFTVSSCQVQNLTMLQCATSTCFISVVFSLKTEVNDFDCFLSISANSEVMFQ